MENISESSYNQACECGKTINIKDSQSFNESNLMTLPFISLKRKRVPEINRIWIRDGQEIALKVVGGSRYLCPTIYELDTLMALFKIHSENINNKINIVSTKTVDDNGVVLSSKHTVTNMPKRINFTYRRLAKEMGLSGFGKATKERLEKSILCLNECTVYSVLAIRDQEQGEYVIDFDGIESSSILKNYRSYSASKWKKANKKLLDPVKIEEYQSIEIDDFFYKNLCNNFLKVYDYDTYKRLKGGVAKKIQLILTQWSKGDEKFIRFQTLCDYIGLDCETKDQVYYANKQIKSALDELKCVGFVQDFNFINDGVNLVFNTTGKIKSKGLNKYIRDEEIVARLREIGINYDDITKHCRLDTMHYIAALLRYVDYRHKKGWVDDIKDYTFRGLPYERYDVADFMLDV